MTVKLATCQDITLDALHRVAWQGEQVTFHPPRDHAHRGQTPAFHGSRRLTLL
jgi:hypothetical protein